MVLEEINTQARLFWGKFKQGTFMSEKTVTISEWDEAYEIQNDGISEFALIGILECVLFDMKTARQPLRDNPYQAPEQQS